MLDRGASPLVLVPGSTQYTVSELKAFIRAHATVTGALKRWCLLTGAVSGEIEARLSEPPLFAEPPDPVAYSLRLPPSAELNGREPQVMLRRVTLTCGTIDLVKAVNWYVPARLPAGVADVLKDSSIPFGQALESAAIARHDVRDIPASNDAAFAQRAVVTDRNGLRLAYVEETFLPVLLRRHAA